MLAADAIEHVDAVARGRAVTIMRRMAELDAVIGKDRVDVVGHDLDEGLQEGACRGDRGLLLQAREGELAGAVDRDEQVQTPFGVFTRMMEGLSSVGAERKTVMIDATYLKAHRTASSLRVKRGISAA